MRVCSRCGIEKRLDEFEKRSNRPLGRGHRCKTCMAVKSRDYYESHPTERREYAKKSSAKHTSEYYAAKRLSYSQMKQRYGDLRVRAWWKVNNAIQGGTLRKAERLRVVP